MSVSFQKSYLDPSSAPYRGCVQIEADGILFDSDGVLVDSHASGIEAWRRIAEEYGLDEELVLSQMAGVRAADTLARHLQGQRAVAATARLEDLEVELSPGTPAVAGAIDLVDRLPDGRWTIVTSATKRLAIARWQAAGIRVPPDLVTAEDVTNGKPDPEPFLAGAQTLGVEPTRCVVFEDSPSGGLAARDAGAIVVAVGAQAWAFEPAARVADLRQVTLEPVEAGGLTLTLSL